MGRTSVTPIQENHLEEIGRFLHENLNRRIAANAWISSLTHPWSETRPNYGVQLRDGEKLVGVFCAIYSDQMIGGRMEKMCNPHSWCVLAEYRNDSIGLVLSIVKQRGYHFTMLTPNPKVAEIFRQLRFKDLAKDQCIFVNLPSRPFSTGIVESNKESIGAHLSPKVQRDYELHRSIPWLRFVAFGQAGDVCLIAYKPDRFKRLSCARIIHVSDPDAFQRHLALLRFYLLVRERFVFSKVESRFIRTCPRFSLHMERIQAKLFLSTSLKDTDITDLYSELAVARYLKRREF